MYGRSSTVMEEQQNKTESFCNIHGSLEHVFCRKETSICGLTCSCCYHTILKPLRQKMNVRRAPNGVSRNSSTNEDVAENSETIIHSSNDTELSTSQMMSDLQLDQSVLASIGERLSRSAEAEHSRSITPINLSRFDGFCSPGCSLITVCL